VPDPRTSPDPQSAPGQAGSPRCLRVGHRIVEAGASLDDVAAAAAASDWDMVELDVLTSGGELVVAHDLADLDHPTPLRFADALATLRDSLPDTVRFDVDIKGVGYERPVLAVLRSLELVPRTLVSTMEHSSLRILRAACPELELGLSVPKARRNYLAHPVTRPAAHVMLAYLRRALPGQAAAALRSGLADAIMAHWGVLTPRLAAAVRELGKEMYVWTVDDPQRLRALAPLHITGVITNDRTVFARAGLE
jgi:glycerophosphoryl diester phosphodiesterase